MVVKDYISEIQASDGNTHLIGSSVWVSSEEWNEKTNTEVENEIKNNFINSKNIEWSSLKTLRDNSELIPGMKYRITDYVTTTTQEDTRSAGNLFDVIVTAVDTNKLSETAYAIQSTRDVDGYFSNSNLNAWELKYCLDNDTTRFAWADETNGKGVIYKMIDEYDNECPYDFKNIQFKRYAITTQYTTPVVPMTTIDGKDYISYDTYYDLAENFDKSLNGGLYFGIISFDNVHIPQNGPGISYEIDETDFNWYYTFQGFNSNDGSTINKMYDLTIERFKLTDECISSMADYGKPTEDYCRENKIEQSNQEFFNSYTGKQFLNNIVFIGGLSYCYYNTEVSSWEYNTSQIYGNRFGVNCNCNTFGNDCNENIFGSYGFANTFGNNLVANTFGNNLVGNTFGNNCESNTFGNKYMDNIFGNQCKENIFGNNCMYNIFGSQCKENIFGNNCIGNFFENTCVDNTFGNNCEGNTFGHNCEGNTFTGGNCEGNTFGNNCYDNTFLNGCKRNSFGYECSNNSLGNNCYDNTFGNNCEGNTFTGGNCEGNTFGNNCYDNTFLNGCKRNSFGYECSNNSLGNNCYDNTFGNNCYDNTFGNNCYDNTFLNGCKRNSFGYECSNNSLGYDCYNNTFDKFCKDNIIHHRCEDNTFGNNCYRNSFSSDCKKNSFGYECYSNSFNVGCESNIFGAGCYSNTFEQNCYGNTFGTNCYSNTFGNYLRESQFGDGVQCFSITNKQMTTEPSVSPTEPSASDVKSYIQHVIVESGVCYVNAYITGSTSTTSYCQNVRICQGVQGVNSDSRKAIDITSCIGSTVSNVYQPANSQTTNV